MVDEGGAHLQADREDGSMDVGIYGTLNVLLKAAKGCRANGWDPAMVDGREYGL